jgi:hypothetical protein
MCRVILRPGPSFQIWNAGREAGGFDTVAGCREVVFSEMNLGLDDGEFVTEVSESVILSTESFDFGGGVPIVEVGNGTTECVKGGGWTVEECVEPYGEGLGDVLG